MSVVATSPAAKELHLFFFVKQILSSLDLGMQDLARVLFLCLHPLGAGTFEAPHFWGLPLRAGHCVVAAMAPQA